jgi:NADH-quinone oxidoreductase subunit M
MFLTHILSILTWLPILGGVLVLAIGGERSPQFARVLALATSLVTLLLSIPLYHHFDPNTYTMQFQEINTWIPAWNIRYALGVDGISMPLILLTNFTGLLAILAGWQTIKIKIAQYMALFLLLQGMLVGMFAALDAMLFYVFWEAMLVPMYLVIGIWGSSNRTYASIKFFLYTFFGSALLLIALLYLGMQAHSFLIVDFYPLKLAASTQLLIFVAFLLAFAVKIPMWPVHTWLPDAHTEAPAGGSILLAALMLKLGGYGLLRFSLPITPDASQSLQWVMIALSLIAIVYIGLVALVQEDMKKLIAYSSIAHMGFVTLGCFLLFPIMDKTGDQQTALLGLQGAMVQMVAHAFSSGALFLGVGILYERLHTRLIKDYGGVANTMPVFAALYMLFAMSNAGLPGTGGFVGEFMVLLSSSKVNLWLTAAAGMTLILGAAYTLWMYKRVFFGEVTHSGVAALKDVNGLERTALILFAIGTIGLGIYPQCLLHLTQATLQHLLDIAYQTKLLV